MNSYAIWYDAAFEDIRLRVPAYNEEGREVGDVHGLDHDTALRLRDELNDALLKRPLQKEK